MEKRVLLAVFLSFLVLFVYQSLVVPPAPGKRPAQGTTSPGSLTQGPQEPTTEPAAAETSATADPAAGPAAPEALVGEAAEREVVVETPVVRAVFTNRGGQLRSWRLKRFLDSRGQPLELIPPSLPAGAERPFAIALPDAELTSRLNRALFAADRDDLRLANAPGSIRFEYRDASGVRASKTIRFEPASYMVAVELEVARGEERLDPRIEIGPAIGDILTNGQTSSYSRKPGGLFFRDGSLTRLSAEDLAAAPSHEGSFAFVGVDDHYFLNVAVTGGRRVSVAYEPVSLPRPGAQPVVLVAYAVRPGGEPAAMRFFFGPKDFDVLAAVDRDLVRAIDFGWFAFLVVPLLRSLKWVNGFVHNYGWSIIILTILINAAMFPLRHKSVVSMRKMQAIQPEVKAIQDRYAKLPATDPERKKMNAEVMSLYRARGANPASGCLPMLLTMPVLFAFYSLLSVAIEIRGAPFILWIKDLSVHDPLYVTPLLMGGTMVWQQKLTPGTADPVQQKMMMLMPIVFTVMFLWAPSGLVIYWFVSNVWAIGQQYVTNWLIGPPVVRVARPPAERRVKKSENRSADSGSDRR